MGLNVNYYFFFKYSESFLISDLKKSKTQLKGQLYIESNDVTYVMKATLRASDETVEVWIIKKKQLILLTMPKAYPQP